MKFTKTYKTCALAGAMNKRMTFLKGARPMMVAAALGVAVTASSAAHARPTGEPQGCANCHYKSQGPRLTVMFSKDKPNPGETITIDVGIKAVISDYRNTGIYMFTNDKGEFSLMDTAGTRLGESPAKVLHAKPKPLDDQGEAKFSFRWKAPSGPGVAHFDVNSITSVPPGSDGKLVPADFHSSSTRASIAFGCDAKTYYPDEDDDGFGNDKQGELSCDPIEGKITTGGDCDDKKAESNPDAEEKCDSADNNCDGKIDEGLDAGLYYPDKDGDGFAPKTGGGSKYTCAGEDGYSNKRTDCDDKDDKVNVDADEICGNDKDDNCNGETDEDCAGGGKGGSGGSGDDDDGGDDDDKGGGDSAGGCNVGQTPSKFPVSLMLIAVGALIGRIRSRLRR